MTLAHALQPDVRVDRLGRDDLVALAALKLIVEVQAEPDAAFEHVERASRAWLREFLVEGAQAVGADPIDASSLGRARAWRVEVARQRRMREIYRPSSSPDEISESGAIAAQTFEALSALEEGRQVWVDVSEVETAPRVRPSRPSRPDSVIVTPVESTTAPGFVPCPDPWSLPLEVTATQMLGA